jgi:hypothetical protein
MTWISVVIVAPYQLHRPLNHRRPAPRRGWGDGPSGGHYAPIRSMDISARNISQLSCREKARGELMKKGNKKTDLFWWAMTDSPHQLEVLPLIS